MMQVRHAHVTNLWIDLASADGHLEVRARDDGRGVAADQLDAHAGEPVSRPSLVEDQTLVRQGIVTLLSLVDDVEVVAEAQDGEKAVDTIPRVKPDVVLLDMHLPKRSGLEVLARLRQAKTLPPTFILTTFDDEHLVVRGLQAGARGFLLKDVSLERRVDCAFPAPGLSSPQRTRAGDPSAHVAWMQQP